MSKPMASVDLAAMAKLKASLKEADKASKRAVTKTLNAAAEPFKAAFKEEAQAKLPHRGGLADLVAGARMTVTKKLSGPRPSLSLKMSKSKTGGQRDLRRINQGKLRHPVRQRYQEKAAGRSAIWVLQAIPAGFFDAAVEKSGEDVTRRMQAALQQAVNEVSK